MNYEVWEKLNKNNRLTEIFFYLSNKTEKFSKEGFIV
jgi:hypothetical protein